MGMPDEPAAPVPAPTSANGSIRSLSAAAPLGNWMRVGANIGVVLGLVWQASLYVDLYVQGNSASGWDNQLFPLMIISVFMGVFGGCIVGVPLGLVAGLIAKALAKLPSDTKRPG